MYQSKCQRDLHAIMTAYTEIKCHYGAGGLCSTDIMAILKKIQNISFN